MERPLVRKQSETLAKEMRLETQKSLSDGWLVRWRAKYGIQFKRQHGEHQSANIEAAEK